MTLNRVDFKKGWMFMLDNCAEWRKFWFVLDNSELRYYNSSDAEETNEPKGKINISCCLNVMEFEADKNYGLQIHMQDAEITLSAMTSRMRRNWIDILQRRIKSFQSPENARDHNSTLAWSSLGPEPTRTLHDEPDMMSLPLTNHREAGVGRDTDQEKRLGDRTKWFQEAASGKETDSPWDKVQLKKGTVACVPEIPKTVTGTDIEKKWKDFEKIRVGEMRPLPLIGSEIPSEAYLQNEGSICAFKLEEIEREHRERLQEMENTHELEMREIEIQREQMFRKETQRAAQAIEALKMAHQEELKSLKGGDQTDSAAVKASLQQKLDYLSDRYTQRCVELTHLQTATGQRHTLMEEQDKEMEQLRKENQELQARLTKEMSLMRSFVTGQRSETVGNYEHSTLELEMLLRVKENELQYLHKEISCLRNEIQTLIKEKQDLSERYKGVYVELCELKGLSDREISSLEEHLRLTNAALEEEHQLRP